MRIFNEPKGKKYEELIKPYETYLPVYFEKLGIAHETYPQALENEEYRLYVKYNQWPIRKLEYSFVIRMMQEAVFAGAKVLDAGCGVSSLPFLWNEFGGEVTAADVDEKSISLMRKFEEDGYFGADRQIHTNICDIADLPFADHSFDVVVSTSVLEHLPYPNYLLAVSELYRVLKEGGTLIMTCDVTAGSGSKRRAEGAFSVSDIKTILSAFQEQLVEEDKNLTDFSVTEEEIKRFWQDHYYEGIGYTGNRGYLAAGFRIRKKQNQNIRRELLRYEELITELIRYESFVADKEKELSKANAYARLKEEENEKLQEDIIRVQKESEERLAALTKVTQDCEMQIKEIGYLREESKERLAALEKVTQESERRLEAIEYLKKQTNG